MTRQDLRTGLEAVQAEALRHRVADGDFSGLAELHLDDNERRLLRRAAEEYDATVGLSIYRQIQRWTVPEGRSPSVSGHFDTTGATGDEAVLLAFDNLRTALHSETVPNDAARRAFVRGQDVERADLVEVLGEEDVKALVGAGALANNPGATAGLRARIGILVAGRVIVVVPQQVKNRGDLTYIGPDSMGLLKRAWSLATGGRVAVDLGTGTGYLAAALAPRYELVIATDRLRSSASVAALTFRLSRGGLDDDRGRLAVCLADIAQGLRSGHADFVIANPPFLPAPPHDPVGRPLTYADGGPTGLEVPARFIDEGARLLAPGGMAITMCLDLTMNDGRRPLADIAGALQERGFSASIEPIGSADDSSMFTERLRARGVAVTAQLSTLVVERSAL